MSTRPFLNIINDGAVIRIESLTKTLLVTKEQVKTIDTIQDNIVRLDIGEGPLKNIFINYQDVTDPVVSSANELRDVIKQMMLSDQYDGGDATENTQISILNALGAISSTLQLMQQQEAALTKGEPSRLDESNPYMVYRGWHSQLGIPEQSEWAIQRVRRADDEIIYEWAHGTSSAVYPWTERENLNYVPFNYEVRNGRILLEALPEAPQQRLVE